MAESARESGASERRPLCAADACAAAEVEEGAREKDLFLHPPLDWLPASPLWRPVSEDVAQILRDAAANAREDVPMLVISGPGVLWAGRATLLLWSSFVVLPFLMYHIMQCPQPGMYAQPPTWSLAMLLPILLGCEWMESKVLSYVLPIQLKATTRFRWLGGKIDFTSYPYFIWRTTMMWLSTVGKASILFSGIFTAKVLKTEACPGSDTVETIWFQTLRQSLLAYVPGMHDRLPSFVIVTWFAWALMLLQPLHAILHCMPIGSTKDELQLIFDAAASRVDRDVFVEALRSKLLELGMKQATLDRLSVVISEEPGGGRTAEMSGSHLDIQELGVTLSGCTVAVLGSVGSVPKGQGVLRHLLLAMRFFRAVCTAWPCTSGSFRVDYTVPGSMAETRKCVFEYQTVMDPHQNHGTALQILASATRMAPVVFQDFTYAQHRMSRHLEQRRGAYKFRYLHLAHHQLESGIYQFCMVGLLECAMQLNLQLSLHAVTRTALKVDHMDKLAILSVGFCFIMQLAKLGSALAIRRVYNNVHSHIMDPGSKDHLTLDHALEQYTFSQITRKYWQFRVYVTLMLLFLAYALLKIYAYFACRDHLVNITGCVVVDFGK
eukprot:TRINITY_DN29700_c0_g5_i1.p1 TRINITY_DN29700_c0_g5~~TRINITY_DN29700_c0_g5_i1.p1  ORF type:complete len:607 (-),score=103.50 TRINITY_DN29700_c0_g5_i1:116-1936(-)